MQVEKIIREYENNEPTALILSRNRISRATLYRILNNAKIPRTRNRRFTQKEIDKIVGLRKNKRKTVTQISKLTKFPKNRISEVLKAHWDGKFVP